MKNDQQQNSANILGGLDDDTAQNNIDCIVYCYTPHICHNHHNRWLFKKFSQV